MSRCIWMPIAAEVALSPRNSLSRANMSMPCNTQHAMHTALLLLSLSLGPATRCHSDEEEERALALGAEGK